MSLKLSFSWVPSSSGPRSSRQCFRPVFRDSCLSSPSAAFSRLVARVRCGVCGRRHSPSWGCWGLRCGGSVPSAVASFQGLGWRECRGGRAGAQGALGAEPGRRGGPQPAAGGAHGLSADPAALQEGETVRTGVGRGPKRILASAFLSFVPSLPFPVSPGPGVLTDRGRGLQAFLRRLRFTMRCPSDQSRAPEHLASGLSSRGGHCVGARPGPPVPNVSVSGCVRSWTDIKPPVTSGLPSGLPFPALPLLIMKASVHWCLLCARDNLVLLAPLCWLKGLVCHPVWLSSRWLCRP